MVQSVLPSTCKKQKAFDIKWNDTLTYGDIYHQNEIDFSHYNFEHATTEMWFRHFDDYEKEAKKLIALNLPVPAYDFVMKASHAFNLLGARGAISVTERAGYIGRIRELAREVAESYLKFRENLKHPLSHKFKGNEIKEIPLLELSKRLGASDPGAKDEFLLEIGTEELPATFVPIGCQNLKKEIAKLLQDEGITFDEIVTYGTPRRITAHIKNISLGKAALFEEKKGPSIAQAFLADGTLSAAGKGFFKSIGEEPVTLEKIQKNEISFLYVQNMKGSDYLMAKTAKPAVSTAKLLQERLPKIIENLEFPKRMRWGYSEIAFARPIHSILALVGSDILPFKVGNVLSNNTSFGHRQLQPFTFTINSPKEYLPTLKEYFVMADMEERKQEISKQLDALEKELNAKIICREKVIPQVLHLVEWPELTVAEFDVSFLSVPKEVLISEMVEHQKYFPVEGKEGRLLNKFVITANTHPTNQIREGNQKVLSARLSDGAFLYAQGLKIPLEAYNEKLKSVMFQKVLGTVFDKVLRLQKHAEVLQKELDISTKEKALRAAFLSKADLATEMVFEFPDLQGTIGKYYALACNEEKQVAEALEEQWMPKGENAALPATETGQILSLADKIDNIIGCYIADLKPTSSSDPYALRRQALGIIKILLDGKRHLELMPLFAKCFSHFPEKLKVNQEALLKEIEAFLINRVKTVFLDEGFQKDEIEAALSVKFSDVYDAYEKVAALKEFRESDDRFKKLFEVYKRAKGQIANQKAAVFSKELLKETAEKNLDAVLSDMEQEFNDALKNHDYKKAYSLI
ncbi:MAG TPA: glycine--tRNA ligase subunit beta, partial [Parachlamydiaceae bacterium]|nr:glycine--tRNA ligase subunit beta [Parachlamydiaceae bacterium]